MASQMHTNSRNLELVCIWLAIEVNLLVGDRLFFVTCKFEMAIFNIVQVMAENIRFAFL